MSDVILAAAPPINNSVYSELSHLFDLSLQYFCANENHLNAFAFINELKTLTGLGYTACFVSETHWNSYRKYFDQLLSYNEKNFRCDRGTSLLLAQAIANMVLLAIDSFQNLNYPSYYAAFIRTLGKILSNEGLTRAGKNKEAQQLLLDLQQSKNAMTA